MSKAETSSANHTESETELVERAKRALSSCNWEIGECAAQWTTRYAKGRGDSDFGTLIGMSGDQIFQRRHVWEKFHDVKSEYPNLSWSHFYVALNWDDAAECLQWAEDEEQTVAGMRAWRRAARGEDLSSRSDDILGENAGIDFVPDSLSLVQDPDDFNSAGSPPWESDGGSSDGSGVPVMAGVNQKLDGTEEYTPFRKEARGDASGVESRTPASPKEPLTGEKLLSRLISSVERCNKMLEAIDVSSLRAESKELRMQFCEQVDELSKVAAQLD